jgi:hypothetical protein
MRTRLLYCLKEVAIAALRTDFKGVAVIGRRF